MNSLLFLSAALVLLTVHLLALSPVSAMHLREIELSPAGPEPAVEAPLSDARPAGAEALLPIDSKNINAPAEEPSATTVQQKQLQEKYETLQRLHDQREASLREGRLGATAPTAGRNVNQERLAEHERFMKLQREMQPSKKEHATSAGLRADVGDGKLSSFTARLQRWFGGEDERSSAGGGHVQPSRKSTNAMKQDERSVELLDAAHMRQNELRRGKQELQREMQHARQGGQLQPEQLQKFYQRYLEKGMNQQERGQSARDAANEGAAASLALRGWRPHER